MSALRDIEPALARPDHVNAPGRHVIAVIGIDRYHHWPRLSNAVRDATGAAAMFERLGFDLISPPLLDEHATSQAIQALVTDDLMSLGSEDSLVLFYAGHGGTRKQHPGGQEIKTGYLIPVDASESPSRTATWIDLAGWLRAVSRLSAKHILVILDACHSGIALDPIIKWRDSQSWRDEPLATLSRRRSRRIITSALDDQVALDTGPIHGHSLFTGCLIEGLSCGVEGSGRVISGSELGLYVQRRVRAYPGTRQTPDFGTFDFDDRGEMLIPLAIEVPEDPATLREAAQRSTNDVAFDTEPTPFELPSVPGAQRPDLEHLLHDTEPVSELPSIWTTPPAEPGAQARRGSPRVHHRWIAPTIAAVLAVSISLIVLSGVFEGQSQPPVLADRTVQSPSGTVGAAFPKRLAAAPAPSDGDPGGCPIDMVPVPGGTFQMGSPDGVGELNEHPQHTVTLTGYCIDITEVTVEAYSACVLDQSCYAASRKVSWSGYSDEDIKRWSRFCNRHEHPNHPVNCIDWDRAATYCAWAGKRLPTEAEWEYAARGTDGRIYPWGNEAPSAERLNACGSECVAMARRDLNLSLEAMYHPGDGWLATAPVGSIRSGASPFGALDMAGNVEEWTADLYRRYVGEPKIVEERTIRGGGWHTERATDVRAAYRKGVHPSSRLHNLGFRCARSM